MTPDNGAPVRKGVSASTFSEGFPAFTTLSPAVVNTSSPAQGEGIVESARASLDAQLLARFAPRKMPYEAIGVASFSISARPVLHAILWLLCQEVAIEGAASLIAYL